MLARTLCLVDMYVCFTSMHVICFSKLALKLMHKLAFQLCPSKPLLSASFLLVLWSCSDAGQEILAVGDCLAKRAKSAAKTKCQYMENGMVDNVVTKIKKMQLSIANGHELYDYISQSQISEERKAKLVQCVDEKLSTPTEEEPKQGFVVKPQLLVDVGSYMTAADWSQLEDTSLSWLAKSTVVIKRLKMLGVRSLHERTSQHCLAALLSTLSKLPDHSMIWEMLLSFKASFKQSELPRAAPYLQTFPA